MGFDTYIRFAVALLVVLGLIAGITWLIRRFGWSGRIARAAAVTGQQRRLSVIEACNIDGRRRLVLVKRDGIEHLILLTANGSAVVIERGIGARESFRKTLDRKTKRDRALDAEAEAEAEAEIEAAMPGPKSMQRGLM